jgi:hypothetical protein
MKAEITMCQFELANLVESIVTSDKLMTPTQYTALICYSLFKCCIKYNI